MHGDEYGCEKYFCGAHLVYAEQPTWGRDDDGGSVCQSCAAKGDGDAG
jgi:hypothetical protein